MTIVITGGHTGIGLELTKRLLGDGHTVGLVVRSRSRLQEAGDVTGRCDVWEADLSDQAQVVDVARQISSDWDHVDVLYNNAGYLSPDLVESASGSEMHLEINTLAPYLLTRGLLPALERSTRPIVVNTVTGGMHRMQFNLDVFANPSKPKGFGFYVQSKLALILLMKELAAEHPRVLFRSVNPGPNKTKMTGSEGVPLLVKLLRPFLFKDPSYGGGLLFDAAFSAEVGEATGVYLDRGQQRSVSRRISEKERSSVEGRLSGVAGGA